MKWQDTEEGTNPEEKPKTESFDEEQYSPWADRKESGKGTQMNKISSSVVVAAVVIVVLVIALLTVLLRNKGDETTLQATAELQERLRLAEERLDKFEAIDEKVTRIWEQAKSYEQFKERFDRGEASSSLRMDHLTMSMETLQKQLNEVRKSAAQPPKEVPTPKNETKKVVKPEPPKSMENKYHTVAAGDTTYSISKKYGMSVKELQHINKLSDGRVLKIGQKLIVGKP